MQMKMATHEYIEAIEAFLPGIEEMLVTQYPSQANRILNVMKLYFLDLSSAECWPAKQYLLRWMILLPSIFYTFKEQICRYRDAKAIENPLKKI